MNLRRISLAGALFCVLALLSATASATQVPGPLVDTQWLRNNLDKVVILDVRKDVKSFERRGKRAGAVNPCGVAQRKGPRKVAGHIPGAMLVPWNKVTAKRKIAGKEIKALLPAKSDFERLMQKSGVDNDSALVITSKGEAIIHMALAARLFWTLKYFGFDNVALLDGGTAQWIKDKQKLEFGRSKTKKGDFKATAERAEILASMEDVEKLAAGQGTDQLVDVRSTSEYLGLTASGKLARGVKGHVSGAKSFPISLYADSFGTATLYDKDRIKQVAALFKVDTEAPTVFMCSAGVMASLAWFVTYELMGNQNARLYDGSMHEWSHSGKSVVSID
ncbi:sulfurtransferase [Candidatus Thiosymbion oneisti]|uniref:sulfurtransferase n=1 Tax=Candidatus Thiosymbion oneisti TaxID=589554 RepID=UPI0013FE0F33|nr:rhodanese-like domain-containing protein [Candidatus Thiosymbion oneisti]